MAKSISRRGFIGSAAAGAAGAAGIASIANIALADEDVSWDYEYDVVIAGMGASGMVCAIEAADNGARVLLVDKAPEGSEGGCSRVNASWITCTDDPEGYYTHWDFLRGGFSYPDDELLRTYTDAAADNWAYLQYLGVTQDNIVFHTKDADLPNGPCSESVHVTWVKPHYYIVLQGALAERRDNIDVWYESPAVGLVYDPATKAVSGMEIEREGQRVRVRGTGGTVLACGGFEGNRPMIEAFLWNTGIAQTAGFYNTGDGIRMCMNLGADLVNMGVANAYGWGIADEDNHCSAIGGDFKKGAILVASNGKRFYNERASARRGNLDYSGNWRAPIFPDFCWAISDQTVCGSAPMVKGFSDDNSAEVEAGTVLTADTVAGLAEKIGVDPETLEATVAAYNEAAELDNDKFDRPAASISPLVTPPFYAVRLVRSLTQTEGGPRRDKYSRVIDVNGEPIPGLFALGEMGCPNIGEDWNCGGNMSESIVFGRIVGAETAALAQGGSLEDARPVEIPPLTLEVDLSK